MLFVCHPKILHFCKILGRQKKSIMVCYVITGVINYETNEIRVQKHENENSAATSGQAYPQRFHNAFEKKNNNPVEIATISTKFISALLYAEWALIN